MDANGSTFYDSNGFTVSPVPSNGDMLDASAGLIDPNEINGNFSNQDFLEPSWNQNSKETYRRPYREYQQNHDSENQPRVPPRVVGRRKRGAYRGGPPAVLSETSKFLEFLSK